MISLANYSFFMTINYNTHNNNNNNMNAQVILNKMQQMLQIASSDAQVYEHFITRMNSFTKLFDCNSTNSFNLNIKNSIEHSVICNIASPMLDKYLCILARKYYSLSCETNQIHYSYDLYVNVYKSNDKTSFGNTNDVDYILPIDEIIYEQVKDKTIDSETIERLIKNEYGDTE